MWVPIVATLVCVLVMGFSWLMVRVANRPPKPKTFGQLNTRGRRTYSNGRPTMPSQVEPEDEFERRAPRHAAIQQMAQDAVDQGVYDKFVEGE